MRLSAFINFVDKYAHENDLAEVKDATTVFLGQATKENLSDLDVDI